MEYRGVGDRMAGHLHVPAGQFAKQRHTLIVEKNGIVEIADVFRLDEIGRSDTLALFKVGIGPGVQHRLRKVHVMRDHHRERLVPRHRRQSHCVPLAFTIDPRDQPQQDIQRGLIPIHVASGNSFFAIVIARLQQESEIQSKGIRLAGAVRLVSDGSCSVFEDG